MSVSWQNQIRGAGSRCWQVGNQRLKKATAKNVLKITLQLASSASFHFI